jgi:flagellar motor switch protein FliG
MSASGGTPLSGPQRAALVVLALEESLACEVLRHLGEADLRRLLDCVDAMDKVPLDALEPTFEAFDQELRSPVPPRGGGSYVRRLAATALGAERAGRLLKPPSPTAIDTLRGAHTATLASLLVEEHPQVAAVLLSQLPPEQAGKVLAAMPAERQGDLVTRIAALEEVPAQAVEMASETLAKALAAAGGLQAERAAFDGVIFAAELLNELPQPDSERLLGALQEQDERLSGKVREAMFTFEDLGRLGRRGLQALMREVSNETLLVALKTASEGLREQFLASVSSRASAQMREDLTLLPATRLSDVERAQKEIVEVAMRLAQEGSLQLPGRGGEKMV